jgi:hypothetical protein
MRQATIEEEKAAMEAQRTADRQRMNKRHKADQSALRDAEARADSATSALAVLGMEGSTRHRRRVRPVSPDLPHPR